MVDGVRKIVALNLWRGTPPDGPVNKGIGDAEFERSRGEAERLFKDARSAKKSQEEELVIAQKIHAARYGQKVKTVTITDLKACWDALPHKSDVSKERRKRIHSVLDRFEKFMSEHHPNVRDCGAIEATHFKEFMDSVEKSGMSARSWNDHLGILRSVLSKVGWQGPGYRDYLSKVPKKPENSVHRRPFSGTELESIFAAAAKVDPELYPVIVAAACTALRRGDVARLKWDSLDMDEGFATVKTTKTGETVEIPIFPPFMAVLKNAEKTRKKGESHVFPKIAMEYSTSPSSLNQRLEKILAEAGFVHPEKVKGGKYPAASSPSEAEEMVLAGMKAAKWSPMRKEKGLTILRMHLAGKKGTDIAAALGIGKSGVSGYLHDMEDAGEVALVSPPKPETQRKSTMEEIKKTDQRLHRGSLCGFHAFRTTFCSLALANGVPMELLTRITGHHTTAVVEKHYNRLKREQTRRAFGAAMPEAIAGAIPTVSSAKPSSVEKVSAMLSKATPDQLSKIAAILDNNGKRVQTKR